MRNPDPTHKRYTSLAWAAVLANEETFEFLLSLEHDNQEYSKVSFLGSCPSPRSFAYTFRTLIITLYFFYLLKRNPHSILMDRVPQSMNSIAPPYEWPDYTTIITQKYWIGQT